MRNENSILEVENLTKKFGGLVAIDNLSFSVQRGEILGIIGPNGAGKTTLINVVSGLYFPTTGRILFEGKDITNLKSHQRCRLGISRTFQLMRPIKEFTVLENVMVSAIFGKNLNLTKAEERAIEICEFVGLKRLKIPIESATVLELKKMEMARALASDPKIVFLDEIMAGLSVDETNEMIDVVLKMNEHDKTIVVVEHVMSVIRRLTNRVIVLDRGRMIAEGSYEDVSHRPAVISAYLGEEE
ncbi:MAG: ABC transporter ATP-binding protein [Thermotogae bacterium]|nr:ABC transporter ATP-binding protein [Thermotogota bacterium]